ncbi:MAG: hypothetical protein IAE80_25970 [Anaerolinea sp.]|nr:hypothetical protein [Anaerolinea sp.]
MKTVQNPEQIEKLRQGVMRFRELLDVLRARVDDGDRMYARLFAALSDEDKQGKKEKDLQTLVAYQLTEDSEPLTRAVLHMQYNAREFEQAFEELYYIITAPPPED